jgi:hypothetical protein
MKRLLSVVFSFLSSLIQSINLFSVHVRSFVEQLEESWPDFAGGSVFFSLSLFLCVLLKRRNFDQRFKAAKDPTRPHA